MYGVLTGPPVISFISEFYFFFSSFPGRNTESLTRSSDNPWAGHSGLSLGPMGLVAVGGGEPVNNVDGGDDQTHWQSEISLKLR